MSNAVLVNVESKLVSSFLPTRDWMRCIAVLCAGVL
jgi:hypothetical protein